MYQRNEFRKDPAEEARSGVHAMFGLIIANIIVFFIQHIMSGADLNVDFALSVAAAKEYEVWRFFSAIFLHDGFMHLFFNMFGLYIFGSLAAPLLGAKRFLLLYLLSGTIGNILWFAINFDHDNMVLLGASGAVMGVILASAMILPDVPMMLLFIPFPIKLKTLAIVYILLDIFSHFGNPGSHTAYLVHVFGAVCGYLFMRFFGRDLVKWDPLKALFGGNKKNDGLPPGWEAVPPPPPGAASREEVERLLIKLSREGINALSEEEQATLRRVHDEMRNNR